MPKVLLALILVCSLLGAPSPQQENDFANAYNLWIQFRSQDLAKGVVSVHQIRQWREVKRLWKQLDRTVRYE